MVKHSVDQKSESELQARLAAIVESSDDAIVSKNLEGIIQSWNRGAERIFGYTAEEVIGKHISVLAVPERLDEIPKILARIARGERVEHYETKRRAKDGTVLTVSLTVSPIRSASGEIIGASKIARDITDRERQRQALEAANAALIRANLDLQHFAYTASHDLREPLRMVSMYCAMLKRKFGGQFGDIGDEYIRYIVDGAERMQTLIDDLLAFTQASVLQQREPEEIDANLGLDAALKNIEAAIKESAACITRTDLPSVRVHPFQRGSYSKILLGMRFDTEAKSRPAFMWPPKGPEIVGYSQFETTESASTRNTGRRFSECSSDFTVQPIIREPAWGLRSVSALSNVRVDASGLNLSPGEVLPSFLPFLPETKKPPEPK